MATALLINLAMNNCITLPSLILEFHDDTNDSSQTSTSQPDCRLGDNHHSLLFSPVESSASSNSTAHLVDQSPKDLSFDLTTFPSSEGRQRTAQACEKCRERKTKCSAERPVCRRCTTRGLICAYSNRVRVSRSLRSRRRIALEDLTDLELTLIRSQDPMQFPENQTMAQPLHTLSSRINNNEISKSITADNFSNSGFSHPSLGLGLHGAPSAVTMEQILSMPLGRCAMGGDQRVSPSESSLLWPRSRDSSRWCDRSNDSEPAEVVKTKNNLSYNYSGLPPKSACPGAISSPTHPVRNNDLSNIGFSMFTRTPLALQVPAFNHVLAYETRRLKETLDLELEYPTNFASILAPLSYEATQLTDIDNCPIFSSL